MKGLIGIAVFIVLCSLVGFDCCGKGCGDSIRRNWKENVLGQDPSNGSCGQ
jgi:hypothetical protein